VLGILALALPFLGLFLGPVAAIAGGSVRRRAMAGRPVSARALRRASLGTLLGMIAILLNLVGGLVWFVALILTGSE
jgi:hypothetical protein